MEKIILFALVFGVSTAKADSLVSCLTKGKNPKPVVEYVIKSTQSLRLNSGIFYTSNNQTVPFDQSTVAQYKTSSRELYLIVDNPDQNVLLKMSARSEHRKNYRGEVLELDPATSQVIRRAEVICSLNPL